MILTKLDCGASDSLMLTFTLALGASARLHTMGSTPSSIMRAPPSLGRGPPPRYFTQQRDHFDDSDTAEWQQAYYVNDTFWEPGSDAPIYLCVGGEGPALDGSVVVASPHCNNAVEWLPSTKALMFAVEHRYYGCHNKSACPYSASDPSPLQWLSSTQALADLATFHSYATKQYSLGPANRWVSFGGSYPGMLASWVRLKYPQLIFAAVASSAPVIAQLDMRVYNDIVAQACPLGILWIPCACPTTPPAHATLHAVTHDLQPPHPSARRHTAPHRAAPHHTTWPRPANAGLRAYLGWRL